MLAQDERLTRRVGAVSLVAIALAIGFFVFVFDQIDWGPRLRLSVFFHTTGGLLEGAPFVVGGRDVGRVEAIALAPHGAPGPLGGDEGVVVTVAIDGHVARELHVADVFVASRGPLAGKYLELGPAADGAPVLRDRMALVGRDPPSIDRVVQHTWDNLMMLARFTDEIRPELEALRAQVDQLRAHVDPSRDGSVPAIDRLGPLIDDAAVASDELRRLRDVALGGEAGRARLDQVIERSRGAVAQIRGKLALLSAGVETLRASWAAHGPALADKGREVADRIELAIARVQAATDKLDPLLAQLAALDASIARGDGSLLKLARDPELPEEAKDLGKLLKRQPWKLIDHP